MHFSTAACFLATAVSGLYWLGNLTAARLSRARVPYLRDVALPPWDSWPRVSLIVAARNEESTLEAALLSRLNDDYPALEVVVVNDRSTDQTGEIAERIAAGDPRVKVIHITQLPEGWLGKLHAMHKGVLGSSGEWLLFSDADVHIQPTTLRRAIAHCVAREKDHLSLVPSVWPASLVLSAVFSVFMRSLLTGGQIWKVEDPRSKAAVGGGLFNLLRRETYERTPGFEWLKLEIADDVMLARMVKQHGGRSAVVNGVGCVGLEFYRDLGDMAKGMEKAGYSILGGYRLPQLCAVLLFFVLAECGWLLALTQPREPVLMALGLATLALVFVTEVTVSRWTERSLWPSLLYPLGVALLACFFLRSGVLGALRGGVTWRGTFYPTRALRAGRRVRLF